MFQDGPGPLHTGPRRDRISIAGEIRDGGLAHRCAGRPDRAHLQYLHCAERHPAGEAVILPDRYGRRALTWRPMRPAGASHRPSAWSSLTAAGAMGLIRGRFCLYEIKAGCTHLREHAMYFRRRYVRDLTDGPLMPSSCPPEALSSLLGPWPGPDGRMKGEVAASL